MLFQDFFPSPASPVGIQEIVVLSKWAAFKVLLEDCKYLYRDAAE